MAEHQPRPHEDMDTILESLHFVFDADFDESLRARLRASLTTRRRTRPLLGRVRTWMFSYPNGYHLREEKDEAMNRSKLLTAFSVGILVLALAAFVGLVFVLPSLEAPGETPSEASSSAGDNVSSPAPDDGSDPSTDPTPFPFDVPEPIIRTPIAADNVGQLVELAVLKGQGETGRHIRFSKDDPLLFLSSISDADTLKAQTYTLICETNSFQELARLSTYYFPPPSSSQEQKWLFHYSGYGPGYAIDIYSSLNDSHEPVVTLRGHRDYVQDADLNSDQTRVVSGGNDKTLRIWDALTGEQLLLVEFAYGVTDVVYSPDDYLVAVGLGTGEIHLLDAESGDEIAVFKDSTVPTDHLVFSRDGRLLIATRRNATIDVWDVQSLSRLFVLEGHVGQITDLAFNADGRLLATTSKDATVRVWDLATAERLWQYGDGNSSAVSSQWTIFLQFSPDGGLLAFLTGNGTGHVWGLPSGD